MYFITRIDFLIKKSRKKIVSKDGFQSRGWLEKPNDRQKKILEELHFKRSNKHDEGRPFKDVNEIIICFFFKSVIVYGFFYI